MKSFHRLAGACLVLLLTGCAITKDGVRVPGTGGPIEQSKVDDFRARNGLDKPAEPALKAAPSATVAPSAGPEVAREAAKEVVKSSVKRAIFTDDADLAGRTQLIFIGTTLALTEYTPEQVAGAFDQYEKALQAKKAENRPATPITREWWTANLAGMASVKYWSVPLLGSKMKPALVSQEMRPKISFPSKFAASMVHASADLVAAEAFENRGVWITRVLCAEKQPDFSDCSKKYATGVFQPSDGREVDGALKVVEDGKQIDVQTFEAIARLK